MILLIDNYDSFSYNLYQLIGGIHPDIQVVRNDAVTVADIERMNPEALILSPGPGRPEDAGMCIDGVKAFADRLPILGVCLGHQALCAAFGATIDHASRLMHGKASPIGFDASDPLFAGLNAPVTVGRYHSLSVAEDSLPEGLEVIARAGDDGEVMAVRLKGRPVVGLQFHPESILTPEGERILRNFITEMEASKNLPGREV